MQLLEICTGAAMDTFCDQDDSSPRLATLLEGLTESFAKGSSAVPA